MARGRSKAHEDVLRRTFEGRDVVDAKHDMRIVPLAKDIKGAVKGDFSKCIFARACRRTAGAEKVLFLRSRAYVELPDSEGNMRVERFMLSEEARALIARFDSGEKIEPGSGFVLKAPSPSKTLESQAQQKQRRRRALLKGEVKPLNRGDQPKKDNAKVLAMNGVRNGTGLIHMQHPKEPVAA